MKTDMPSRWSILALAKQCSSFYEKFLGLILGNNYKRERTYYTGLCPWIYKLGCKGISNRSSKELSALSWTLQTIWPVPGTTPNFKYYLCCSSGQSLPANISSYASNVITGTGRNRNECQRCGCIKNRYVNCPWSVLRQSIILNAHIFNHSW